MRKKGDAEFVRVTPRSAEDGEAIDGIFSRDCGKSYPKDEVILFLCLSIISDGETQGRETRGFGTAGLILQISASEIGHRCSYRRLATGDVYQHRVDDNLFTVQGVDLV